METINLLSFCHSYAQIRIDIHKKTKLPDTMHGDFPPSFPVCRKEIYNVVPFLFINYRIYMALDETMKTILIYV